MDAYGISDESRWWPELARFVEHIIYNPLPPNLQRHFDPQRREILGTLDAYIAKLNKENAAIQAFSQSMTPSDFEQFCASELKRAGWATRLTKGSGDQGVDVIAERQGVILVVQCKLYSKTVGNKAVMEVTAGRDHERAHYAAVCSNQSYSSHAKELARTNGVFLLHYSELAEIHHRLTGSAYPATEAHFPK